MEEVTECVDFSKGKDPFEPPNMKGENPLFLQVAESTVPHLDSSVAGISVRTAYNALILSGEFVTLRADDMQTVCVVLHDQGVPEEIRLSSMTRKNLSVQVKDSVLVEKCDHLPIAKRIQVLPLGDRLGCGNQLSDHVRSYFAFERPVHVGDVFATNKDGKEMQFQIVEADPSPFCIVAGHTLVSMESEDAEKCEEIAYSSIVGCHDQLSQIRSLVETKLKIPSAIPFKGILIHGPSGTGKSMIANAVCQNSGAYVCCMTVPDVMKNLIGDPVSNLRATFEGARKRSPTIILMDELDAIAPDRNTLEDTTEKKVVLELITMIDKLKEDERVVVIGVTSRVHAVDPALMKPGRFGVDFGLSLPDKDARLELLRMFTEKMKLCDDVELEELAEMTRGFTGADLRTFCSEAGRRRFHELVKDFVMEQEKARRLVGEGLVVRKYLFDEVMREFTPKRAEVYELEKPHVSWEEIVGLPEVKLDLLGLVQPSDKYENLPQSPTRGILLYGPSGCGKTMLARALATEWKAKLIRVNASELVSNCPKRSLGTIQEIFNRARLSAPCVMLIDKIDLIARVRSGDGEDIAVEKIYNYVVSEINGIQNVKDLLVIGTTDQPGILDPAILRPGRLSELLYVPLPDRKGREIILRKLKEDTPLKHIDEEVLASDTSGFSGRDLMKLLQRASRRAICAGIEIERNTLQASKSGMRVDPVAGPSKASDLAVHPEPMNILQSDEAMTHCLEALKLVKPSLTPKNLEYYNRLSKCLRQKIGIARNTGFQLSETYNQFYNN